MANVFAYGILMSDGSAAAKLHGYRIDFGYHATVVAEEGSVTYGTLIRDVSPGMLARYDAIEGARGPRPYYRRESVWVSTGRGVEAAWVYVMDAATLAAAKRDGGHIDGLVQRMHHEYDMVGHAPDAHEELDRRAREWNDRYGYDEEDWRERA